jgi:hypothetical protein
LPGGCLFNATPSFYHAALKEVSAVAELIPIFLFGVEYGCRQVPGKVGTTSALMPFVQCKHSEHLMK